MSYFDISNLIFNALHRESLMVKSLILTFIWYSQPVQLDLEPANLYLFCNILFQDLPERVSTAHLADNPNPDFIDARGEWRWTAS
jgi:hypothetical protein